MSKKLISLAIAIGISSGLTILPSIAYAHQVKSDNSISGFVHVAPYDQPRASQPTQLHISLSDRSDNFSLLDCACYLSG